MRHEPAVGPSAPCPALSPFLHSSFVFSLQLPTSERAREAPSSSPHCAGCGHIGGEGGGELGGGRRKHSLGAASEGACQRRHPAPGTLPSRSRKHLCFFEVVRAPTPPCTLMWNNENPTCLARATPRHAALATPQVRDNAGHKNSHTYSHLGSKPKWAGRDRCTALRPDSVNIEILTSQLYTANSNV